MNPRGCITNPRFLTFQVFGEVWNQQNLNHGPGIRKTVFRRASDLTDSGPLPNQKKVHPTQRPSYAGAGDYGPCREQQSAVGERDEAARFCAWYGRRHGREARKSTRIEGCFQLFGEERRCRA